MTPLQTTLDIQTILEEPNLAKLLSEDDLAIISGYCADGFRADLMSREPWEVKMSGALKLALQVCEDKSFPWEGASNVKFPLLTIAALQYHSRAYPALINAPQLVLCQTFGKDPSGQLAQSAQAISEHMSWQLLEENAQWEDEMDRALLVQPILGSVFKKSFFDKSKGYNVSQMVLPGDLVVNYWASSLEDATRITHIQYLTANDFHEKTIQGLWIKQEMLGQGEGILNLGPLAAARDETRNTQPGTGDHEQPHVVLEMCCYLDLDGDGYKEPYVVTFRHDTNAILRIVANFFETGIVKNTEGEIAKITPESYYTKYPFIPSPDGGFYDLGFGVLLGPINEAIDSAVNQLIDAGTMSNAGGGFLGRGIKVKGGNYTFAPNEWKRVDSTGDDLRTGIFPLPVREPSAVLFQLLTLLIQYGERVGAATEAVSGENPGQNTKVGTMDAMIEQGLKIFSGIYKRTYRAMKNEFRKLFHLNKLYLNDSQTFQSLMSGEEKQVLQAAYQLPPTVIRPAADPEYMSDRQRMAQAQAVRQASLEKPLYDQLAVERWYLETMKVPGIDGLLLKELPPPSPPIQLEVEKMRLQAKLAELAAKDAQSQLDFRLNLLKLMNDAELAQAKIVELQARSVLLIEQAATSQMDEEIALINAQIGAAKIHHEGLLRMVETFSKINQVEKGVTE